MSEKLFNVGIKAVIVQDSKVLLIKNVKRQHDPWEFPGGRMDADETIEQTLQRELKEELPNVMEIKIKELLGAHRIHSDIKPDVSLVLIFYRVEAVIDGDIQLSSEHSEYRWVDVIESRALGGDDMADLAKRALQNVD